MERWTRWSWMLSVGLAACAPDVGLQVKDTQAELPDPLLLVTPAFQQFDELSTSDFATVTFVISNEGDGVLDVDRIRLVDDNPAFEVFAPALPVEVRLGDHVAFDVRFQPVEPGLTEAEIQIISDAQNGADYRVRVAGVGAAPDLELTPDLLRFPDNYVGCRGILTFNMENVGGEDLVVSQVNLSTTDPTAVDTDSGDDTDAGHDGGDDVAFGVTLPLPLTLDPFDDRSFSIIYEPTDVDEIWSRYLVVDSNDPESPHVVPMRGAALPPPLYTEQFTVPADWEVDIILAIDQSGSMGDQAQTLADEIGAFTGILASARADWKLAVATGLDPGCFVGVYDGSAPDWTTSFSNAVRNIGADGELGPLPPDTEALLTAVSAAGDLDQIGSCNEGFRRAGVPLEVIMVSDEREQSNGFTSPSTQYWQGKLGELERYAGVANLLTVHGILDVNSACGQEPLGTGGYAPVILATGGVTLDVCGSWADDLPSLAGEVAANASLFELARTDALPESVAVSVDGSPLTTGWTYKVDRSAVVFDVPPDAGAVIDVTYTTPVDCTP